MIKEEYARKVSAWWERSAYGQWVKNEGVAVFRDWFVPDVWKLETKPWPRLGGNACFNLYPPASSATSSPCVGCRNPPPPPAVIFCNPSSVACRRK